METSIPKLVRELPSNLVLKHGSHSSPDKGMCAMEAVAWVAGEPHSDHPKCASPVLGAIMRGLNDRFTDDERQLLAPLIPRLVGTRAPELESKRAYAMVDAAIRELAPMGLDAVKWTDLADRMRAIAPIVDLASANAALAICREIRSEAWDTRKKSAAAYAAADAAAYAADAADAYAAAYAYADADAAADAADAAAYAADAAAAYAADAYKSPEERARVRSLTRRPIVEATVRAYERVIAIAA